MNGKNVLLKCASLSLANSSGFLMFLGVRFEPQTKNFFKDISSKMCFDVLRAAALAFLYIFLAFACLLPRNIAL